MRTKEEILKDLKDQQITYVFWSGVLEIFADIRDIMAKGEEKSRNLERMVQVPHVIDIETGNKTTYVNCAHGRPDCNTCPHCTEITPPNVITTN